MMVEMSADLTGLQLADTTAVPLAVLMADMLVGMLDLMLVIW